MRADQKNASFISQQIASLQRNYLLMVGLILLFVCVLIWTLLSVASIKDESDISAEAKKYTKPLNPNFDQLVLEQISQKKAYSAEELADFPIFVFAQAKNGGGRAIPIDTPAEVIKEIQEGKASAPIVIPRATLRENQATTSAQTINPNAVNSATTAATSRTTNSATNSANF